MNDVAHTHHEDTGAARTDRSVSQLLKDLSHEVTSLVHKETELLKAEVRQGVHEIKVGITSSGLGVAVLFVGFFWLAGAGVYGLGLALPMWASALIVGGAVCVVGAIMLATARKKLSSDHLRPRRTEHQLHKDAELARRKTP